MGKINMELPESAVNFLRYLKAKNKSIETIKGYDSDLHVFFNFISTYKKKKEITKTVIRGITLKDLYMFMSYLEEEIIDSKGNKKSRNAPSARARKSACLKSYYYYIYKVEKIVAENIAEDLEPIKIPDKEVIYLNKEQANTLLESLTEGSLNYTRDLCILTIFLNTGLRLAELQSLRTDMVKGKELTIIGKGMKKREVFLNDKCLESIKNYLETRDEEGVSDEEKKYLFLSRLKQRIGKNAIENMVKKCLKNAGFGEEYHTHTLRASFCTNVYSSGKVGIKTVRDLMGHSSISTTQKYLGVTDEDKRNAIKDIY